MVWISAGFILFLGVAFSFGQTVSEEARRHMVRGFTAVKLAASPEDFDQAIKEFQEAARLAPDWATAWYNLGLVQERTGNIRAAFVSFNRFLRLAPKDPEAAKVQALIYELEYKAEQTAPLWKGRKFDETYVAEEADIFYKDANGLTLLHWAAMNCLNDAALQLIALGADINAKIRQLGNTPLYEAALNCDLVAMTLIVNGANVNVRNEQGKTPLHGAAVGGHVEAAEALLDKGADLNAKDESGETPLAKTCVHGQKAVAKLLIDRGADMSSKNNEGDTRSTRPPSWAKWKWPNC